MIIILQLFFDTEEIAVSKFSSFMTVGPDSVFSAISPSDS